MKSQDELADQFATELLSCYHSPAGCKRLPVRMVGEIPIAAAILGMGSGKTTDIDMVMLCVDHAKTYQPSGQVIYDNLISAEQVEFYEKHNL